jgi:hypothetical protein
MGVVGPEGLSQVSRINRLRCLTIPGSLKLGLALRGKCLTFQTQKRPPAFTEGHSIGVLCDEPSRTSH